MAEPDDKKQNEQKKEEIAISFSASDLIAPTRETHQAPVHKPVHHE